MPHAEDDAMSHPMTNGDKPCSQFLNHLTSYPVVSDSISTYKSNPYGQRSLDLASSAYSTFAGPLLPYLRGPYSYVAPYVARADSLGDAGLDRVDAAFPVVKEDTQTVKATVIGLAFLPLHAAGASRDYLEKTFKEEYRRVSGNGLIKTAKAVVSTELRVTGDAIRVLSSLLRQGKEQVKEIGNN